LRPCICGWAIRNLSPKILGLLRDEYSLHKGVRKQIQFLSEELESIHGALSRVAAVPSNQLDEQVKIWARQAREASYDMEASRPRHLTSWFT